MRAVPSAVRHQSELGAAGLASRSACSRSACSRAARSRSWATPHQRSVVKRGSPMPREGTSWEVSEGIAATAPNPTQLDCELVAEQTAERSPQRRTCRVSKVVGSQPLP
jgi:hypothetical protein